MFWDGEYWLFGEKGEKEKKGGIATNKRARGVWSVIWVNEEQLAKWIEWWRMGRWFRYERIVLGDESEPFAQKAI